ncbi:hypothetical protein O3P69_008046 [Scylla paramamosain]|uniref:C2 domain-containing protein n=1 Tax=Scylla paramamosain TaxID=85552 RepID=A0AAW0T1T2_SCYPA
MSTCPRKCLGDTIEMPTNMSLAEKLRFSVRVPSSRRVTAVHLVVETLHTWCCCLVRKRSTPIVTIFLDPERQRKTHGAVEEFSDCRFTVNTKMIEQLNQRSFVKMKVKNRNKTVLKYYIDAKSLIEVLQNHGKFSSLHITLNAFETPTASTVEIAGEKLELAAPAAKREHPRHASKSGGSVSGKSSGRGPENSTLRRRQRGESLTPSISPKYQASPGQYEVRVIVWSVAEISRLTAKEIFPDVYFKVRMSKPRGEWRLTDVHYNCVKRQAFFNYRLVLPSFSYPAPPRRVGLFRRKKISPPTLEVVMMDRDEHTGDDYMGRIKLNLEDVCTPDDLESCGMNTLTNKRVNLFDASAVQPFRDSKAVFPRELTGYWPTTMKSKISMKCKRGQTGSVLMTVQLLSAQEAAERPVVQGNRLHPLNRYPTLPKPKRKHGKIGNLIVFGFLEKIEQKKESDSEKPQDHSSSQKTRDHVKATRPAGRSFSQSGELPLWSKRVPLNEKCKHFLSYLECEECRPKLDDKQCKRIKKMEEEERKRLQKERRKRVKALNDELL